MSTHAVTIDVCEIQLGGLLLPMGLRIESCRISGRAVTALDDKPYVQLTESADVEVVVDPASIAEFLERKAPAGLSKFRVEAADGFLRVHAHKRILIEVPAVAVCQLRIQDGREIHVDLRSVEVMGGASITELVRSQISDINPLLDVSDIPVPLALVLTSVVTEGGKIVVRGKAEAP